MEKKYCVDCIMFIKINLDYLNMDKLTKEKCDKCDMQLPSWKFNNIWNYIHSEQYSDNYF